MKEYIFEYMSEYEICEYQFQIYFSSFTNKTSPMSSRCRMSPRILRPTHYPRYLFQGPTANFIAVLVETRGGIDLKNITTCAEKSWFFNS